MSSYYQKHWIGSVFFLFSLSLLFLKKETLPNFFTYFSSGVGVRHHNGRLQSRILYLSTSTTQAKEEDRQRVEFEGTISSVPPTPICDV